MEGKIQKVTCDSFYYNLKLLAETLDIQNNDFMKI